MNPITENTTLAELVTRNFHAASVFEKYGLDFCCNGKRAISDACREQGINIDSVFSDLAQVEITTDKGQKFDAWELDFLIDYIINNHHEYVKNSLPVIYAHTQKIASVHGERHPELFRITALFEKIKTDFEQHLTKEENILFPSIKRLVEWKRGGKKIPKSFKGSSQSPIRVLEIEHQNAGDELYEMRTMSNNFTPPDDGCTTYTATYKELDEFEKDLHQHVHLENNILHPKALALEMELMER